MIDSGRIRFTFAIYTASVLFLTGCPKKTPTTPTPTGNGGPTAWTDAMVKPSGEPWKGKLNVKTGDWNAFQKLVDFYKGKVVVAGFWASWSEKVVPQIRQLARLQNKFEGKIIVLQVAVDPETPQDDLEQTVRKWVGPELPPTATVNLFISTQNDEKFNAAAKTIEAVPTIFVYDQSGKRTKIFLGGEKVIDCGEKVVPLVERLLK